MPAVTVTDEGVIAQSLAENLAELEGRLRTELGEDLVLDSETPQGQIAGILALALTEMGEAVVADSQHSSIQHSGGVRLRDLLSLLDIRPREATRSVVTATLTGVAGVVVPSQSRARTAAGDQFRSTADATLTETGVAVEFESVEAGPIEAAAGDLSQIVSAVTGWEGITNASAAALGRAAETDAELRLGAIMRTARQAIG